MDVAERGNEEARNGKADEEARHSREGGIQSGLELATKPFPTISR